MEQTSKYLPQTASALAELKESVNLLDSLATASINEKVDLEQKLTLIRQQLAEKASQIENIITTLNGAIK